MASSAWAALVGLAVVPLYLKYLGIEAYGLIGFFATLQALFWILDLGLAPAINREVARSSASGNIQEAGNLLHTLSIIYWSVGAAVALFVSVLSPLVSEYWLQSRQLSVETITHAVILMGLIIACRWPVALYQGALMGAQRLVISSGISIAMVTIGSFGAVVVLAFVSPTIEAFFVWQACVGLVHAAIARWAAWHVIGRSEKTRFEVGQLRRIWRFSAGMSGIGLTTIVFTQLDKVILSKTLELEAFGHYMLAALVVSALSVLVAPVFNAVYPRFSTLVATDDTKTLTGLYRLGTRALATVLFQIAMLLAVFANDFVHAWTGNSGLASSVAPIISLLAIGSALHGVMHFPYALQLAYGMTRLPLTISIILIIIHVPLVIYFALSYDALGGALAWLILQLLYVFLGTWLTHRHLLRGVQSAWLLQDVGIPLALAVLTGLIAHYVIQAGDGLIYMKLMGGGILALGACALSFLASPQLRHAFHNIAGRGV